MNAQLEQLCRQLSNPSTFVSDQTLLALNELKEQLEVVQSSDYPAFLQQFLPSALQLLNSVPVEFSADLLGHQIRNSVLELLQRLPCNEFLRPFAASLLQSIMQCLNNDNEENAAIALRILIELHKNFRQVPELEDYVQPFFEWVKELLAQVSDNVSLLIDQWDGVLGAGSGAGGADSLQSPHPSAAASHGKRSTSNTSNNNNNGRQLLKASQSFKVLAECPIIFVLLFQMYKKFITTNIPALVPLIVETIKVRAQVQMDRVVDPSGETIPEVGMSSMCANKTAYADLIGAQVKIVSFLAYIIRGFANLLLPHQPQISQSVLHLLIDCPNDQPSTRKELLVALRHLLSSDFRHAFVPHLPTLFHPEILIGTSLTAYEGLRPLAFSMLADLVHHVRGELTPGQLRTVVEMYIGNLGDSGLAPSIQTMCAKLLLNLVENCVNSFGPIPQLPSLTAGSSASGSGGAAGGGNADDANNTGESTGEKSQENTPQVNMHQISELIKGHEGRQWLLRILDAFITKFQTIGSLCPHLAARYAAHPASAGDSATEKSTDPVSPTTLNSIAYPAHFAPIFTSSVAVDHYWSDIARDYKFLFKTLVLGMKGIVNGVRRCSSQLSLNGSGQTTAAGQQQQTPGQQQATPQGQQSNPQLSQQQQPLHKLQIIDPDELQLFVRAFVDGLKCFPIFRLESLANPTSSADGKQSSPSQRPALLQEEKEILEHFVTIFTLVDPAIFQEVVEGQMDFFFEQLLEDPTLLAIPQYLLASEQVSRLFSGILLKYMLDKLEELGGANKERASLMLRLFKLVFMAVTLFPEANESVLQPHMNDIIMKSMEYATKAVDPNQYFLLLRALFRNIGGGRFELLYKEVLPLLPFLLKRLNAYLATQDCLPNRSLFVELCLTVPVRLSVLLPYLHYLVKPLVLALQSGPELVSQGLRTLELCIDNLTAEFLDPILAPSMEDLMSALWKHLKPLPYHQAHAHATLRILGKLGGRNRRIWQDVVKIENDPGNGPAVQLPLLFDNIGTAGSSSKNALVVSLDEALKEASNTFTVGLQARLHAELTASSSSSSSATTAFPPVPPPEEIIVEKSFDLVSASLGLLVDFSKPTVNMPLYASLLRERIAQPPTKESVESCRSFLEEWISNLPKSRKMVESMCLYEVNNSVAHRHAQMKNLDVIFGSLFAAMGLEKTKERAWSLMKHVARHFALLKILETYALNTRAFRMSRRNKSLDCLDANVFLEAAVKAMTSEFYVLREASEKVLTEFYETVVLLLGSEEAARKFSAFHWLSSKFCSACYRNGWSTKWGGVCGIVLLTQKLRLGGAWILDHELEFVKALLIVLKDLSSELWASKTEEIHQTLRHIISVCHEAGNSTDIDNSKREVRHTSLLHLLVTELSNSNVKVRHQVQNCLKFLASTAGITITALLDPVKDRLLNPIFSKPLRALPFTIQIGYIDAITFCLSLDPPLMEWNDELIRLLHEALALADADDQSLTSRSTQLKNAVVLTQLRTVCVKLLSVAIASNEFSTAQKWNSIRYRIVQVFFKSLYSKADDVVEAAKTGLRQSIANQNKLPKDLLQTGLRPILLNLSNHKHLTVDGLLGLGRLLEILTTYFKVEIGKKLLDHLHQWAQPAILDAASAKLLNESHEIKLITSILDIIHLLPPAANTFMDDMVQSVLQLEASVRRYSVSPFRAPLLRYLNRFAEDAVPYFIERLGTPAGRLLVDLSVHPDAETLRQHVLAKIEDVAQTVPTQDSATVYNFIALLSRLSQLDSELLIKYPAVTEALRTYWAEQFNGLSAEIAPVSHVQDLQKWRMLSHMWIQFLKLNPDQAPQFLLDLVDVLVFKGEGTDFYFVHDFLCSAAVSELFSVSQKRAIIFECLGAWNDSQTLLKKKIMISRYLITPLLTTALVKGEAILDSELLDAIRGPLWSSDASTSFSDSLVDDNLMKLEYLQLSALLVKYAATDIADYRKDIIKYAWGFLKFDDTVTRQAAYVVLSYFIRSYDTPQKIVVQIFVTLLRTHQSESRVLVKQALDVMAPALPERLADSDENDTPTWVRWTKKILVEDGHVLAQLIAVWQMIVRQSDLLYDSREQLVQYIVGCLAKLGLMPSATSETRILTLDLVELVLKWEKHRVESISKTQNAMEVDEPSEKRRGARGKKNQTSASAHEYIPNVGFREMILNYLVRFLCTINEPLQKKGLANRIVDLMKSFFEIDEWVSLNVRTNVLERFFQVNDVKDKTKEAAAQKVKDVALASVPSILAVLQLLTEKQSQEWLLNNLIHVQVCLEKCLTSENVQIIDRTMPVLKNIYASFQEQTQDKSALSGIGAFLGSFTLDGLMNGRNIYGIVMSLQEIANYDTDLLDSSALNLCKLFQKLCKDYSTVANSPQGPIPTVISVICAMIRLLNLRLGQLGESRKTFAASLAMLMEKSGEASVHRAIFEVIKSWLFESAGTNSGLTAKEKSFLALRFASAENKCDHEVFQEFLQLIFTLYKNETFVHTELTVRLEPVFLIGMRWKNPELRASFVKVFEQHLPRNLFLRLTYVLGVQNWEYLANSFWIGQALDVLLSTVKADATVPFTAHSHFSTAPLSMLEFGNNGSSKPLPDSNEVSVFLKEHTAFLEKMTSTKLNDFVEPLKILGFKNHSISYTLWVELFTLSWESFSLKEQQELNKALILTLSREYHLKQADLRPNVPQALLDAAARCGPPMLLPPQVVKYLAKKCNAWYIGLSLLEATLDYLNTPAAGHFKDVGKIRESAMDAKCELYSLLSHEDWFYGLWRRRCLYPETDAALSYEQVGLWQNAQAMYESAQIKARNGVLSFSEHEYTLWEDRWISCTQKLQQWDILMDLAKAENNVELQLECSWRITDWSTDRDTLQHSVLLMADRPSPRRKVFEAFLLLSNLSENADKMAELQKVCDEGLQLSLRQWHQLPSTVSQSHTSTLHIFQQFVELQEASHIYIGVGANSMQNKLHAVQELKGTLGTWRDRLPNLWDDINLWSELVAWRQHVFSVINKAYQPLAEQQPAGNSLAYRGYHEIAWIINRFAHVARKHHLTNVCINALTKIYTLPNIEIHDAFLKLREQAKCYVENPTELATGLEVINNTNLGYFQQPQRAEFFTLKGIFLGKLGMNEEANQAFSSAIQIDMNLAKGWAAWAQYHDRLFAENSENISSAADAVNCYLHAIGLYKNARCRKFIARVLWLLGQDDQTGAVAQSFDAYKGEVPTWYWITFIPQLLNGLSRKDAKFCKNLLIRIAKSFPQALYFHLRTARKEFAAENRSVGGSRAESPAPSQNLDASGNSSSQVELNPSDPTNDDSARMDVDLPSARTNDPTKKEDDTFDFLNNSNNQPQPMDTTEEADDRKDGTDAAASSEVPASPSKASESAPTLFVQRTPAEHAEEIMAILKTAFPLLALSIETTVDQILARLKPSGDDDIYRIAVGLLTEGLQQLSNRVVNGTEGEETQLTTTMLSTFERFINSSSSGKMVGDDEFAQSKPNLEQLVHRYRLWRDRMESFLDNRPRKQNLEHLSHYLVEFEYQRFDEVEVPGQYMLMKNNNTDFVKIERFVPEVDYVRGYGIWYRRITIIGHEGSEKSFIVQNPCARHSRREERVVQLFRLLNEVLMKRKDTRQRNLAFHLPLIVPLSVNARLVEDDSSYVSMQEIYEDHCERMEFEKDLPIMHQFQALKNAVQERKEPFNNPNSISELTGLKVSLFEEIAQKYVPSTVLTTYFARSSPSFSGLWMLREQLTRQLATVSFITYVMSIGHRLPQKVVFSRATGRIWMTDLLPLFNTQLILSNPEAVPFRLTPNLQTFVGAEGLEGPFMGSLAAIASNLGQPQFDLNDYLGLFFRDELSSLQKLAYPAGLSNEELNEKIHKNCAVISKKVRELSCMSEKESVTAETMTPVFQPLIDLISAATNPQKLGTMDGIWQPWL